MAIGRQDSEGGKGVVYETRTEIARRRTMSGREKRRQAESQAKERGQERRMGTGIWRDAGLGADGGRRGREREGRGENW